MVVRHDSVLERGQMVVCEACGRTYSSTKEDPKECEDCVRLRSLGLEPRRIRN